MSHMSDYDKYERTSNKNITPKLASNEQSKKKIKLPVIKKPSIDSASNFNPLDTYDIANKVGYVSQIFLPSCLI